MSELHLQGEVIELVHDDENFTLTVKPAASDVSEGGKRG